MEQLHQTLVKSHFVKYISIFIIIISISCKAQVYPLNTNVNDIPNNAYIKDIDNKLNPFVGEWKANIGNRIMQLKVTKLTHKQLYSMEKLYYKDILAVQYTIKDASGNIIESTISNNTDEFNIKSYTFIPQHEMVRLAYDGGKCTVGWGFIFFKMTDSTHFKWNYRPESTVLTNKNCPDYPAGGIKINLPDEPKDIIFTKQ